MRPFRLVLLLLTLSACAENSGDIDAEITATEAIATLTTELRLAVTHNDATTVATRPVKNAFSDRKLIIRYRPPEPAGIYHLLFEALDATGAVIANAAADVSLPSRSKVKVMLVSVGGAEDMAMSGADGSMIDASSDADSLVHDGSMDGTTDAALDGNVDASLDANQDANIDFAQADAPQNLQDGGVDGAQDLSTVVVIYGSNVTNTKAGNAIYVEGYFPSNNTHFLIGGIGSAERLSATRVRVTPSMAPLNYDLRTASIFAGASDLFSWRVTRFTPKLNNWFQSEYYQTSYAQAMPQLQRKRGEFGTLVTKQWVYVLGGVDGNGLTAPALTYLDSIERAQINVDDTLGPFETYSRQLVKPRMAPAVLRVRNFVYVIGGADNFVRHNSIEVSTINDSTGELGPFSLVPGVTLPGVSRSHAGSALIGNSIYLFGGYGGVNGSFDSDEIVRCTLDASANITTCEQLEERLPFAQVSTTAQVINNRVVVTGGFGTQGKVSHAGINDDGSLQPFQASTVDLAATDQLAGVSTAVIGGRIYFFGGIDNSFGTGGAGTQQVRSALVDQNGLSDLRLEPARLNTARGNAGIALVGNMLYAIGGHVGQDLLISSTNRVEVANILGGAQVGAYVDGPNLAVDYRRFSAAPGKNRIFLMAVRDASIARPDIVCLESNQAGVPSPCATEPAPAPNNDRADCSTISNGNGLVQLVGCLKGATPSGRSAQLYINQDDTITFLSDGYDQDMGVGTQPLSLVGDGNGYIVGSRFFHVGGTGGTGQESYYNDFDSSGVLSSPFLLSSFNALPDDLSSASGAFIGQRAFFLGGQRNGSNSNQVSSADLRTTGASVVENVTNENVLIDNHPRCASLVVGNYLHVFSHSTANKVERALITNTNGTLTLGTWQATIQPDHNARIGAKAFVIRDYVWIIGGHSTVEYAPLQD